MGHVNEAAPFAAILLLLTVMVTVDSFQKRCDQLGGVTWGANAMSAAVQVLIWEPA